MRTPSGFAKMTIFGLATLLAVALLADDAATARRGRWPFGRSAGGGQAAQGARGARALTAQDLVRTPTLSDPQISPDGRSVVFVVTWSRIASNDKVSNLYVLPLDRAAGAGRARHPWPRKATGPRLRQVGGATRLTTTDKRDFAPRFTPDGRWILFLSTREKGVQLWRLPVGPRTPAAGLAGGEAVRLSRSALGFSGAPVVSPGGDRAILPGDAYPQCRTNACNRKEAKRQKTAKVQAQLFTGLLYRHWDAWRHGRVSHLWTLGLPSRSLRRARGPRGRRTRRRHGRRGRRAAAGLPTDLTPGRHDVPPIALGGAQDYTFSPDGREIAFVKNTDPVVATSTNNDVFIMPSRGGPARRITTNRGDQHSPAYSPDGRTLAYLAMTVPGYESDRQRLVVYDRRTRKARVLTEAFDRSVRSYVWSPDSKTLYFTAPDRGYVPIFRVSRAGGPVRRLVEHVWAGGLAVTPDGKSLIFISHATHRPPEIYRAPATGGRAERLTFFQAGLERRVRMLPVEHLWYRGAQGDKVHALLVKPPGFRPGRRYPLVVMVHGGPQGMIGDEWHPRWNAQLFAAPGYAVLMPNFHGSRGYGQKFCDSIQGDWGGKPYQDVMKSVDAALAKYRFLDRHRICATGASYGGYMMNWIGGHTTRFRCIVTHDGVFDLRSMYGATEELWFPEREYYGPPWKHPEQYRRWSPSRFVRAWRTPTLVIHGQHDYRVPVTQGMQLFTSLQRLGVPSQFLYFPDETHFVQKARNRLLWWRTVHRFLGRYLKRRP